MNKDIFSKKLLSYNHVYKSITSSNIKVSVIISIYNKENWLDKNLSSIISQTLDSNLFEIIIVDDCSNDSSLEIVKKYIRKNPKYNWNIITLDKNSGTPAVPRNIGLEEANGQYIMIVDADDWLEEDSLEYLSSILDKTGDDYILGMCIEHKNKSTRIVAEQGSCDEFRSVTPLQVNDIFKHLAPVGRMFRKDIVSNNNLFFPELKYGEDKFFFMHLLIHCKKISTTTKVVYHVNRLSSNKSLVTKTTPIEKAQNNYILLNYVIQQLNCSKKLKFEIVKRIISFDLTHRFINTKKFIEIDSEQDLSLYIDIFKKSIDLVLKSGYKLNKLYEDDYYLKLANLILTDQIFKAQQLVDWKKNEANKEISFDKFTNIAYYVTNIEGIPRIKIPLIAFLESININSNEITVRLYGHLINKVRCLELRSKEDVSLKYRYRIAKKRRNKLSFILDTDSLMNGKYSIFILFNRYKHINIIIEDSDFYKTIKGNIALNKK